MALPEITSDINSIKDISPKSVASLSSLREYEHYFDYLCKHYGIDGATACLIITCPESDLRERIWNSYMKERDDDNQDLSQRMRILSASISAIGEWYTYMSSGMGLMDYGSAADIAAFANVSPKKVMGVAAFRLHEKYTMYVMNEYGIDGLTACLISHCPDKKKRQELWGKFTRMRDVELAGEEGDRVLTASVVTVGEWFADMCYRLDLVEESTMAG